MSLTEDLIRLSICRPLLLIDAALLITKSQTFGLIVFIVSPYCMEVCMCAAAAQSGVCLVMAAFVPLCVQARMISPFFFFFELVYESFATAGAAYVMCLCLTLKCKSANCLTACASPTFHCKAQQGRYLPVMYLHVYKMGSSARLNC